MRTKTNLPNHKKTIRKRSEHINIKMKIIISKKVLEIDKDYDKKLKQSLDFNLE
jgi:hypothetical protein